MESCWSPRGAEALDHFAFWPRIALVPGRWWLVRPGEWGHLCDHILVLSLNKAAGKQWRGGGGTRKEHWTGVLESSV